MEEEQRLNRLSLEAKNRPKEIFHRDGSRFTPVLGSVHGTLDRIDPYLPYLLSELNADSLLAQQLLGTVSRKVINNSRSHSLLQDYVGSDGTLCMRFEYEKSNLRFDSIRWIQRKTGKMELNFSVMIPVTRFDGESLEAESFSMEVEAAELHGGEVVLTLLRYPQHR